MKEKRIEPIARIKTDFPGKFGIPRQSGIAGELEGIIEFEKDYADREAIRGIEEFTHLWLIWGFSENESWSPTVRPPRLGGNVRKGVFATRSPFRPNGLGLSCVRLHSDLRYQAIYTLCRQHTGCFFRICPGPREEAGGHYSGRARSENTIRKKSRAEKSAFTRSEASIPR